MQRVSILILFIFFLSHCLGECWDVGIRIGALCLLSTTPSRLRVEEGEAPRFLKLGI